MSDQENNTGESRVSRRSRRFLARPQPPVEVPQEVAAQPEAIEPPQVPSVPSPREEYERLAKLVPTLKRDTPEWKQAMAEKKAAAEKLNASR